MAYCEQIIVERNGRPLAAIIPISSLADIEKKVRKRALDYLESGGSNLSDEEAAKIAVAGVKSHRSAQRKKKSK